MSIDVLFADFDRLIQSAESVHRLRRFVLDLAVRGKLVPQDPNNEPALKLLERIAIARTASEFKQIRNRRKTVNPSLTKLFFPLPAGWSSACLSDLAEVLNGRAYKKSELLEQGTPVLRVGNLFTSKHWYYSSLDLDENKYCEDGDLIYAWSASFGPFIWRGPRAIFHYHIWKILLFSEDNLNKKFLYNFLLQKTREIKEAGHGVSMVHMTKEKMEQLAVPVPPLSEQNRIVAKIDELMDLCDQLEAVRAEREGTRDRLATASLARLNTPDPEPAIFQRDVAFALNNLTPLTTRPDQIKALRQTILNLAVRGKLVPQDPNDEPTSELLKRIAAEKARLVKLGKLRAQKSFPPFATYSSPELPSGWRLSYLGDVIKLSNGFAFKSEDFHSRGIPVIRIGDLRGGKVDLSNAVCVSEKTAESVGQEIWIPGGALLIAMSGATTGKVAFNKTGQKLLLNQRVGRIETFLTSANFVKFFFETIIARNLEISFGTAIPNLSAKQINETVIPLPPVAEQHRIVAKVDELMTLCDRLEVSLVTAEETLSRLLIALLDEALRGNKTTNFPLPDIRLCRNRNENS